MSGEPGPDDDWRFGTIKGVPPEYAQQQSYSQGYAPAYPAGTPANYPPYPQGPGQGQALPSYPQGAFPTELPLPDQPPQSSARPPPPTAMKPIPGRPQIPGSNAANRSMSMSAARPPMLGGDNHNPTITSSARGIAVLPPPRAQPASRTGNPAGDLSSARPPAPSPNRTASSSSLGATPSLPSPTSTSRPPPPSGPRPPPPSGPRPDPQRNPLSSSTGAGQYPPAPGSPHGTPGTPPPTSSNPNYANVGTLRGRPPPPPSRDTALPRSGSLDSAQRASFERQNTDPAPVTEEPYSALPDLPSPKGAIHGSLPQRLRNSPVNGSESLPVSSMDQKRRPGIPSFGPPPPAVGAGLSVSADASVPLRPRQSGMEAPPSWATPRPLGTLNEGEVSNPVSTPEPLRPYPGSPGLQRAYDSVPNPPPAPPSEASIVPVNDEVASKELSFNVPDNETNLMMDADGQVRAGSFSKLVERLTGPNSLDVDDFLLTYRSYATPKELLNALIVRFNSALPQDEKVVRLKTLNTIRAWVERYWDDFELDKSIISDCYQFLDYVAQNFPESANVSITVKGRLDKKVNQEKKALLKTGIVVEKPILPSDLDSEILKWNPVEIARQLTLMEWDMWENLKPTEFLGLSWTKSRKRERSPHVLQMTDRFNEVSGWVLTAICTAEKLSERIKVMKKFLEIAEALKKLGNFNGMMEILSAFDRGPLFRMKKTFGGVMAEKKYAAIYNECKALSNRDKNYSSLRAAIKLIDPPVIPYLGMYLTDLIFTDEGNKDMINGLINFSKYRQISETIKKIKQYQLKGYENLSKVSELLTRLQNLLIVDEDTLYDVSNYLEPREDKEPGPRPPILDKMEDMERQLSVLAQGSTSSTSPNVAPQPSSSGGTSAPNLSTQTGGGRVGDVQLVVNPNWPFYFNDQTNASAMIIDPRTKDISALSLPKLIERLTHHSSPDFSFLLPFLATYREIIAPSQLLDLLFIRFDVPPPEDKSSMGMDRWEKTMKAPINGRVINLLRNWLLFHWNDFQMDGALLQKLRTFVSNQVAAADARSGQALNDLIERKLSGIFESLSTPPQPRVDPAMSYSPGLSLMTFDPLEFARQLCLDVNVHVMNKINAGYLLQEVKSMLDSSESLLDHYDLSNILTIIQGKNGVEVKDRRKKMKSYAKCFPASELVACLMKQVPMTHNAAVVWGKHLLHLGVIESAAEKSEPFEDDDELWRFVPPNARKDVVVADRLQKMFNFSMMTGGAVKMIVNAHLLQLQNLTLGEINYARKNGTADTILKFFITVCRHLDELNNWHCVQGIVAGLQKSLTPENKEIWERVNPEDRQWFITTRKMFLTPDELKARLLPLTAPYVPCFTVFLDALTAIIHTYGQPLLGDGMVNYPRMLKLGQPLAEFAKSQQAPPGFILVPVIAEYLLHPRKEF